MESQGDGICMRTDSENMGCAAGAWREGRDDDGDATGYRIRALTLLV
jgi:hypothetical protein